ncbi:MAG TPA: hypothetical protein VFS43_38400 [Polyangiaceae bacterium]|nr:hypothetical protein [Polyangiaceae bacterium]
MATLKIDGKMSWDECWNTPATELYEYVEACVRRAERLKRNRESKR